METVNEENYEAWFLDHLEGRLSAKQAERLAAFLEARPDLRAELEAAEDFSSLTPTSEDFGSKEALKKSEEEARDLLLFDLAEGNLEPEDRRRAEKLLEAPDIRTAFEGWKLARLQAGSAAAEKDALYRFGEDCAASPETFDYLLIARNEGLLPPEKERELADYIGLRPERLREEELYAAAKLKPPAGISFPDKEKLKRKKSAPVLFWFYRAAAAILLLIGAAAVYNSLSETSPNGPPAVAEAEKETARSETTASGVVQETDETAAEAASDSTDETEPAAPAMPQSKQSSGQKKETLPGAPKAEQVTESHYAEQIDDSENEKESGPSEDDAQPLTEPEILREVEPLTAEATPEEPAPAAPRRLVVTEAYAETFRPREDVYKTIPEWAAQTLVKKVVPKGGGQLHPLLAMADRAVTKAGDAVEFVVDETEGRTEERKSWILRVGGVEIEHNRRKQ